MLFYILFSLGFLIFGTIQFIKTRKLVKEGITTSAKIVDIKEKESTSQDSEGFTSTSYSYAPVFELDKKGEKYTIESSHAFASKNKFKIGDSVEIIYLESKPENASIKKGGVLWLLPIVLLSLGVLFLILAFVA